MHWDSSSRRKRWAKCAARRKNGKDCFAVVLIDEVDSLGTSRRTENSEGGSEGDSALNQLLAELDGCGSGDQSVRVVTIGTTNRLNMLDPGLVRPGRMDGVYVRAQASEASANKVLCCWLGERAKRCCCASAATMEPRQH